MNRHLARPAHHLVLAACLALTACGDDDPPVGVQPGVRVASEQARILTPSPAPADLADQVAGNTAFALDLYRQLAAQSDEGNLFYSPHSIEVALAMAWAGARGETEDAMAQALHLVLDQDRLHPVFNQLDLDLASRGRGASGADGREFRLNVVNSTWGQSGFDFLDEFLDVLALHYGAGIQLLDFARAPEEARGEINRWVETVTEQRIRDLIPSGVLNTYTRLVLVNAIYFNAAWAEPFDPALTADGAFSTLAGPDALVPLMNKSDDGLRYAAGEGYQAVEMPYDGGEVAMLVLVPEAGGMPDFEERLRPRLLAEVDDNLRAANVVLTMPRWELDGDTIGLRSLLTSLGMGAAFTPDADFSGMTGGRDLMIAEVLHQAFVKVNEAGTEAAAATAVPMELTAAPLERHVVRLDRPFVYIIRDQPTGQILFVGRLADPS